MSESIFQKQHVGKSIFCGIHHGISRSSVKFPVLDDTTNQGFRFVVICSGGSNLNICMNGKQIIVKRNRTNVLIINMVITGSQTSISDQICSCEFFVQHHSHFCFQPCSNVKVRNIDHIVAIHFLFLIYSCRFRTTFDQAEEFFLLHFSFDVTFCTSIVFGDISKYRFHAGEWSMMHRTHNIGNPTHISLDKCRLSSQSTIVREKIVDLIDTVLENSVSQTSKTFRIFKDRSDLIDGYQCSVGMHQDSGSVLIVCPVKNVFLHVWISFF